MACKHSARHMHMQLQAILILKVLALMATAAHCWDQVYFDTNSYPISIDNWYLACIYHNIANFFDTPKTHFWINQRIRGAKIQNVQIGMIRWQWEDDQVMIHNHTIPDSYYILYGQIWLL